MYFIPKWDRSMNKKRQWIAGSLWGAGRQETGAGRRQRAAVGWTSVGIAEKERAARVSGLFLFYLPIFRISNGGGKRCQLC